MKNALKLAAALTLVACSAIAPKNVEAKEAQPWKVGTPIATYYAGPGMTEAVAKQMAAGGFNLVWCSESEMKTAQKQGLRIQLQDGLLTPATLDNPEQLAKLDALIARVKDNPALYSYYLIDEPNAALFPGFGKLVAHLRKLDPAHMAYINLFPTYANNDQLGNKGDTIAAYKEHLKQFTDIVKPDLLSYDHYHFQTKGEGDQYFLNLGLIRQHALDTGIPFMNIVQACTWDPGMRAPNANEMRWLTYTSLAYGADALSWFVYHYGPFYQQFQEKAGQMMRPDGSTTEQYAAAKQLNPEFVAIASELQPLRSLGAYHVGKKYWGAEDLPANAPFRLDFSDATSTLMPAEGMVLGYFGKPGKSGKPTHVVVVNLNFRRTVATTVVGPGPLSTFDATTRQWKKANGSKAAITLPPGGGMLVRVD